MARVNVTIAGKTFRMACDDGQEQHLEGLAAELDAAISRLRASFGEIGDQRLTVMAAITFADSLSETRRRVENLEAEMESLRAETGAARLAAERAEGQAADAVAAVADRIGAIATRLGSGLDR